MNTYPWDTREQQALKNPYTFADAPPGMFVEYLRKREVAKQSLHSAKQPVREYGHIPYTPTELKDHGTFETIRVAASLLHSNEFATNPAAAMHAARLLKKVNVRALKDSYDHSFKNMPGAAPVSLETLAALGVVFAKQAQEGDSLALSTALKLNDTIVARLDELQYPHESAAVYESLTQESQALEVYLDRVRNILPGSAPQISAAKGKPIMIPIGLYAQDTHRTKAFIQTLLRAGYLPSHAIIAQKNGEEALDTPVPNELFDLQNSTQTLLERAGIPYTVVRAETLNDTAATSALASRSEKYFVFSGRGKLTKALEQGKQLIHVHPGKLPDYRGSTTIHYQLLDSGNTTATAFFMEQELDAGSVIGSCDFEAPWKGVDLTRVYDPFIRSTTLASVFKDYATHGKFTAQPQHTGGREFYVIHPLLEDLLKRQFA